MDFLNDFLLLLKARYPIIYINTYEEERVEYIIRLCTKKYISRTYYSWDFINGYQGNPNDSKFAAKNGFGICKSDVIRGLTLTK